MAANVHDVAAYILAKRPGMSAMKLQKLVYYSQAWHLVWDDEPLFPERIQAWANGPVVRELFEKHRGRFRVSDWPWGDATRLTGAKRDTIDAVLATYGKHDAHWLSDLTHLEDPWRDARRDLPPGARGGREITKGAMVEYYSGLDIDGLDV